MIFKKIYLYDVEIVLKISFSYVFEEIDLNTRTQILKKNACNKHRPVSIY